VRSAGLDSSAGALGGAVSDGFVALLAHPAHRIAAARVSGSAGCFISELLPDSSLAASITPHR